MSCEFNEDVSANFLAFFSLNWC